MFVGPSFYEELASGFRARSSCGATIPTPGKYNSLISGEAESHVSNFLESEHTLQEFTEEIDRFRSLAREISALDDVVTFDMFHLECHDIKHGLVSHALRFANSLVQRLAENHIRNNER